MSVFKDFGFDLAPDRFRALLEQPDDARSTADSEPTSKALTLSNIRVATTSRDKSDNASKVSAKHQMTEGGNNTEMGVPGSAAHKAIAKDKLEHQESWQSNTQKKKNIKAIADAEGVSVTSLKKKLKAERAAKALVEQKAREFQDKKQKNKQEKRENIRAAAKAEGMSITGYKKQLNEEKAARALADEEAMKCKEVASV